MSGAVFFSFPLNCSASFNKIEPGNQRWWKISLSKSEWSNLYQAVKGVLEENENLSREVLKFENQWERVKTLMGEMENTCREIRRNLRQNSTRIAYIHQYLDKLGARGTRSASGGPAVAAPPPPRSASPPVPGKKVEGVMLFVSPDPNLEDTSGFATRQPRREMLPTEIEEKMILEYVRREGIKLTKSEYKTIYKKVSNMLVSAPKNAIAIQLRLKSIAQERRILELFYHINVNNRVEYASFKYIEIKGVEFYRSLKSV